MDDEKEGKPSNRPKLIPSFVEGSLNCPPSLDFGIFGHISYITPSRGNYEPDDDHDESYSQSQPGSLKRPRNTIGDWIVQGTSKTSHLTLKPIRRLQQFWKGSNDYVPLESTPAEKSYKQKIGSLLRDFPDLNMPENLLKSFMKFDYNFRKRLSLYDPTMGNVVCSLDFLNRGVAVLSPSGLAGQVLGLSRLAYDEEETVPKLKLMGHSDSYEFKTPINQITAIQFDSMNIIAARTHGHITFLSCKPSPYFNSYTTFDTQLIQPLDEIHLLDDPFHVTFNPFYPGEAACVSDDGFIHIWSLEGSRRKSRMRSIVDPIDRGDSRTVRWMSCEYGVSPKDLLVASEKDVHLMDIRSPRDSHPLHIHHLSNRSIYALSRHPHNQLTCVVASREYISVLDTRYPLKPVIQWSHHQHYEPPSLMHLVSVSLQYQNQASSPQQNIIISANRRSREIVGYTYAESSPAFLSTHSDSLFMNKSFSMLNAVPHQSLSSPFNIPSSRSNETLRPYTETSMHRNIHQITFPNEPPLTGICSLALNLTKQNFVAVVQSYADGSLYSQLLKVADQTSFDEESERDLDLQRAGQPEEGEEKLRTHKYFMNELLQDPVHKHYKRRYDYIRKRLIESVMPSSCDIVETNNVRDREEEAGIAERTEEFIRKVNHRLTLYELRLFNLGATANPTNFTSQIFCNPGFTAELERVTGNFRAISSLFPLKSDDTKSHIMQIIGEEIHSAFPPQTQRWHNSTSAGTGNGEKNEEVKKFVRSCHDKAIQEVANLVYMAMITTKVPIRQAQNEGPIDTSRSIKSSAFYTLSSQDEFSKPMNRDATSEGIANNSQHDRAVDILRSDLPIKRPRQCSAAVLKLAKRWDKVPTKTSSIWCPKSHPPFESQVHSPGLGSYIESRSSLYSSQEMYAQSQKSSMDYPSQSYSQTQPSYLGDADTDYFVPFTQQNQRDQASAGFGYSQAQAFSETQSSQNTQTFSVSQIRRADQIMLPNAFSPVPVLLASSQSQSGAQNSPLPPVFSSGQNAINTTGSPASMVIQSSQLQRVSQSGLSDGGMSSQSRPSAKKKKRRMGF